jgi:hypothetical protein
MRRLQQVEDEVIQIAFADALGVRPIELVDVPGEGGGGNAAGGEASVKGGGKIGPRNAARAGRLR